MRRGCLRPVNQQTYVESFVNGMHLYSWKAKLVVHRIAEHVISCNVPIVILTWSSFQIKVGVPL